MVAKKEAETKKKLASQNAKPAKKKVEVKTKKHIAATKSISTTRKSGDVKPKKKAVKTVKVAEAVKAHESCNDRNCPYCGALRTHGRMFEGTVVSDKMQKTIVVKWPRQKYIPKYERYLKVSSRVKAHNPQCIAAKAGEKVRIAECRPISKTVSFVVVEVLK